MVIEKNSIDELNAELVIRIQKEDYSERFEKALKDYRKQAQLPGFRPGQVPTSLIKKRFGKSILAEEINGVLMDNIYRYISENKIKVLGSPIPKNHDEIVGNWEEPDEFRFKYEMGIAPEIELSLDKSQTFIYHKINVDDVLINRQVKDLARRYGKMSEPEISGPEELLVVELNELNENTEVIPGGISSKTTISIEFIKDEYTKNQLTGLKRGDTADIDPHQLSKNHEDLAKMLGITHHQVHHLNSLFRIVVTDIKHIEAHELNQELFDKIYGPDEVKSEDEMRSKVKTELEGMFQRDSDWMFKRDFALTITNRINPSLPDEFLKRHIMLTNDKPLTYEMVDYEYPVYAGELRWNLIQGQILKQYEIKVTLDDAMNHLKETLMRRYAAYGMPIEGEYLEDLAKKALADKEEAKNIYDFLYEQKMIELVKSNCTLEEKTLSYDEFVHRVQH
ncbi:MAG: trigger factor [Flavobacteriales bacterium]|nr:trigger factor [Flavobacteriales bacterium]